MLFFSLGVAQGVLACTSASCLCRSASSSMSFSITACFISFVCSRSSWRRLRMDSSLAWILRSSASCWSLRREISDRAFSSARESTCSAAAAVAASAAVARSFAAATSASAAWTLAFNSAIMASEASALARTVASSSLASVASLESAAFSAVSSLRRLSAALSFLADVSRALASCSLVAPASAAPARPLCALWGSLMVGSGWLDQRVKGEMLNLLFLNR